MMPGAVAGLIEPAEVGDAGKVDESSRSSTAVVGAILFLAAVESAWQLHHRCSSIHKVNPAMEAIRSFELGPFSQQFCSCGD